MISRTVALLLLAYAIGFILFAFTLGKSAPADSAPTDAAIVLTGGPGRIEHAIDILRDGKARRLLVAGADPSVTKADLASNAASTSAANRSTLGRTRRKPAGGWRSAILSRCG
jgi:uncharacterized SAM-binding protein YcdF (DUF218 family)